MRSSLSSVYPPSSWEVVGAVCVDRDRLKRGSCSHRDLGRAGSGVRRGVTVTTRRAIGVLWRGTTLQQVVWTLICLVEVHLVGRWGGQAHGMADYQCHFSFTALRENGRYKQT